MDRASEPWHLVLVATSRALAWLLAYDRATRRVRAHFHDGPPRPMADGD